MNSNKLKYCNNCGESLENLNDKEIIKCPKCGINLQPISTHNASASVVEQLPYKSPGTAALIAFIGGIFGLPGLGHIYVGKVGKGIGILIGGIIIAFLLVIVTISIQGVYFFESGESSTSSATAGIITLIVILSIAYFVLFIWQIFNARKLAKKFNESVRTTGKEPW